MNKISLYLFLVLVYLGLSKSFSPQEQSVPYIADEHALAQQFTGAPLSLILLDSFQTGFLIHTYFHRYKAIYVFKESEEFIVRTSESFWRKNLPHQGLSLLRREDVEPYAVTTTPVPAGSLFIGNPFYGTWESQSDGSRYWVFHNAYRSFPEIFSWGDFQPDYNFYTVLQAHLEHDVPFFGLNKEFGTSGSITSTFYSGHQQRREKFRFDFLKRITRYFAPEETEESTVFRDENQQAEPIPIEEIEPFLGERPAGADQPQTRSIFDLEIEDGDSDE